MALPLRQFCHLAAAFACAAVAQHLQATEEVGRLRSWGRESLGVNAQAWTAVTGPDGAIYVGANDVRRFDGDNWRGLAVPGGSVIRSIAFGADGRMWVAANGEIGYFELQANRWSSFHSLTSTVPPGADIGDMWNVFADPDGAVFISQSDVLRLRSGKWSTWKFGETRRLQASLVRAEIWFHHQPTGLWVIEPEGPRLRIAASRLSAARGLIQVIGTSDGGTVFVSRVGLFRNSTQGLEPWSTIASKFAREGNPTSACALPDGRIAIGSLTGGLGLVSADGTKVRVIDRVHGLPSQSVFNVTLANDGTLWCAMPTHVAALDVQTDIHVWKFEDSHLGNANGIAYADGATLLATNEGVFSLQEGEFRRRSSGYSFDILPSAKGVLIGGAGKLEMLDGDRNSRIYTGRTDILHLSQVPGRSAYLASEVRDLSEIGQNEAGAWVSKLLVTLPSPAITHAWEGPDSIWVTTTSGKLLHVQRGQDDRWAAVPVDLPGASAQAPPFVARVGSSTVGFSSAGGFVIQSPTGRLSPIAGMPALPVQTVSRSDSAGRVWVAQRSMFFDGDRPLVIGSLSASPGGVTWTLADIVTPTQGGEISLITADDSGNVWLSGTKTLIRLPAAPAGTRPALIAPRIGTSIEPGAKLPFSHPELRFEFSTGEFLRRSELRFQTRLVGLDADWSSPRNDAHLALVGLREGAYELEVRTVNALGQSSPPARLKFTVLPPWYRSSWALTGFLVVVGGSIAGAMSLRQRMLVRRNRILEEAVQAKTAELSRANAAKSEFIANISHEIRHPIAGILGGSIALQDSKLTEDQQLWVRSIQRCGGLLHHLVSDVLDLAKIEAGAFTVENAPFTPLEVLQDCAQMMAAPAAEAKCRVVVGMSPLASGSIQGDAGRIQQILVNFLSNAFKFAPGTEVELSVVEQAGARIRFVVRDRGPGISAEDQSKLFKRFTRLTRKRGSVPGSGLGLALCLEIARRMQGDVGVESAPGAGSTFYLELPLVPAEPTIAVSRPRLGQTKRALIVDDIDYAAAATAAVAQHFGFEVVVAHSATEALAAFSRQTFDLVLLDWDLGDHDGLGVLRAMRREEAGGRRARILAATAHATEENRQKAMAAGFDGFLTKPITLSKFSAVVELELREILPAVSVAADNGAGSLNLEVLRGLAGSNSDGLAKQIDRLLREVNTNLEALRQAVTARRHEACRYSAHRLVNDARMIQAEELVAAAEALHRVVGLDDHALASAMAKVEAAAVKVTAQLRVSVAEPLSR